MVLEMFADELLFHTAKAHRGASFAQNRLMCEMSLIINNGKSKTAPVVPEKIILCY